MFYYNQESGWKPYTKKVTYTEPVTIYENDTAQFDGKDNLVITDVILTPEQLERLEVVGRTNMGLNDVIEYVVNGVAQGQVIELDKANRKRRAFLNAIDLDTAEPEVLQELSRPWEPDGYFTKGEPVSHEGKLYKVLQSHPAQPDRVPGVAHSLFAPFLISPTGEVLPWVQPESTNPYQVGDKVTHKGKTWLNEKTPNNVWEPGVYGWVEVT